MITEATFKILSLGVIGLGFLLALLSFYLLRKEQGKETPNRSILKSVYIFMAFSLLLAIMGFTSEILRGSREANVKEFPEMQVRAKELEEKNGNLNTQLSNIKETYETQLLDDKGKIAELEQAIKLSPDGQLRTLEGKQAEIIELKNKILNLEKNDQNSQKKSDAIALAGLREATAGMQDLLQLKTENLTVLRNLCQVGEISSAENSLRHINDKLKLSLGRIEALTK